MNDEYVVKVEVENKIDGIAELPECPFIIRYNSGDEDIYIVSKESYDSDKYTFLCMQNGISYSETRYNKDFILERLNSGNWELVKGIVKVQN
jgi:hypothetical protein